MSDDLLRLITPLRKALNWKGAMGFRDVIAHQYFDLDSEQVLLICRDALPGVLAAIRSLERIIIRSVGAGAGSRTFPAR